MERQFNNGDFEKQLRDNANQYRMYPSEKVWKNIHSALHTRRRWYGITAAIMFLISASIVSIIIYNGNPDKNNLKGKAIAQTNQQLANSEKISSEKYTPAINKEKGDLNKPRNVEELVRDNQVFNFPKAENGQDINADLLNESAPVETIVVFIPSSSESSIIDEPVNNDLNLVRFNSEIKTEHQETLIPLSPEKVLDQNILNIESGNKIQQTISALSSQNAPVITAYKQKKVTAQVYFTPTVSYRKLTENKRVYNSGAFYVPVIDLNNVVKHKPAMGLEFGIEGRYRVNNKLSLKSGFQFNINRYDIRAYSHTTEIATVALNSGSGFDSMATTTNYRNFSGGSDPNWLENFYFQATVPIGVEYIISENKNLKWGVSGTIQPTYVIGDRAYMLSSDYKNYARFPDLMRRWNISTGFGTFVSYSTGKIKWQVGPHVRYQHLSSFVSALTVREKLFAIGLKVGATLNK